MLLLTRRGKRRLRCCLCISKRLMSAHESPSFGPIRSALWTRDTKMFVLEPPKKLLFLTSAHKLTKKEEQAHYHLVVAREYTDEAHICAQNGEVAGRCSSRCQFCYVLRSVLFEPFLMGFFAMARDAGVQGGGSWSASATAHMAI